MWKRPVLSSLTRTAARQVLRWKQEWLGTRYALWYDCCWIHMLLDLGCIMYKLFFKVVLKLKYKKVKITPPCSYYKTLGAESDCGSLLITGDEAPVCDPKGRVRQTLWSHFWRPLLWQVYWVPPLSRGFSKLYCPDVWVKFYCDISCSWQKVCICPIYMTETIWHSKK